MEKRFLVNSLIVALLSIMAAGPAAVTGQGATGGGTVIGEAGELTFAPNNFNSRWKKIYFENTYASTPVVIATVVTENQGDNNGLIPVINAVTKTYFWISVCRDAGAATCGATSAQETVHYFVFDVDKAQGYDWIDVGTRQGVTTDGGTTTLNYKKTFENVPVIWTTPQTYSQPNNNEIAAVVWTEDAATKTKSSAPLIGCVHQGTGDACTGGNPEDVGYVAIDTANVEINGFQTGYADISDSTWTAATFSPGYTNPRVMVTQNDDDGGQDPQYPWARNVVSTGMDFRYCEQDAAGICDNHTDEVVNWFAVENGDIIAPGHTFTSEVQIWPGYPLYSPPYSDTVPLPNPTLYLYQPVRNAPYPNWPDAMPLLVEAGNKTNQLNTLLVIRNWGDGTNKRESELRFDAGAWNSSKPDDFSYMQAAIYTRGDDQVLRLKPGPFVADPPVLGQLRVENTNGAFITKIVAGTDKSASLTFVETTKRDSGNETASIYRPEDSYDLRVFMVGGGGNVMTFKGKGDNTAGNIGIGTTSPKSKLQVTNGDVYVETIGKGIILRSPNGSCFRVTVENTGSFKSTGITCP